MDPCEELLSCNETVMGGSPEVVFPQPPTDAIHKEGSCSSNLPCIFKSVLALGTKDTPSYTRSSPRLRRASAPIGHSFLMARGLFVADNTPPLGILESKSALQEGQLLA